MGRIIGVASFSILNAYFLSLINLKDMKYLINAIFLSLLLLIAVLIDSSYTLFFFLLTALLLLVNQYFWSRQSRRKDVSGETFLRRTRLFPGPARFVHTGLLIVLWLLLDGPFLYLAGLDMVFLLCGLLDGTLRNKVGEPSLVVRGNILAVNGLFYKQRDLSKLRSIRRHPLNYLELSFDGDRNLYINPSRYSEESLQAFIGQFGMEFSMA